MTRWLPPIGLGLGLAVVAAIVLLVASPAPPSLAERADALAAELRCPDCQGLSVADSPTASASEIRRQIEALLASGASDDEVRSHFVARYGEWIRLAPSNPALWLIPLAVVIVGLLGFGWWLLRGARAARGTQGAVAPAPSEAERRAVRDEAEALDA